MKKAVINKASSPKVVVGDLPLLSSCKIKEVVFYLVNNRQKGDCRQRHSAMTTLFNKSAFTLIELLVVVLIIGVLTAIALPQYQLAVEKARSVDGLIKLKTLADGLERYYLANGTYPATTSDLTALDIAIPTTTLWRLDYNPSRFSLARRNKSKTLYSLAYIPKGNSSAPGRKSCDIGQATDDNATGSKVCKSLCRQSSLTRIWGQGGIGCVIPN